MKINNTVLQSTAKKDGTVFSIQLNYASEGSTRSEMIRNLYNNFLKEVMFEYSPLTSSLWQS